MVVIANKIAPPVLDIIVFTIFPRLRKTGNPEFYGASWNL
jgi:hypothetical protein